ncbi:pleckstrin homology-like domain family A member 3 isoform X1 [Camelus ferus]|uniref:Pleckstrin homology-like domain family A member 3 isoform X1 n=1 Tax=Camelus ferus TaxID=419612 RepID=A0A8B8RZI5_CAMFR|nr:pleckstrin homology-like domain family A member 3 isoform X1 [Camelus ferus]XP_032322770.1 pleckstrin homology-like domain family A member 3 isoform X1 [Camelus ferus]XP_032322771.1 pleckstrin homology-like domain family A member 3 isoform X1 [Camelus ferus]
MSVGVRGGVQASEAGVFVSRRNWDSRHAHSANTGDASCSRAVLGTGGRRRRNVWPRAWWEGSATCAKRAGASSPGALALPPWSLAQRADSRMLAARGSRGHTPWRGRRPPAPRASGFLGTCSPVASKFALVPVQAQLQLLPLLGEAQPLWSVCCGWSPQPRAPSVEGASKGSLGMGVITNSCSFLEVPRTHSTGVGVRGSHTEFCFCFFFKIRDLCGESVCWGRGVLTAQATEFGRRSVGPHPRNARLDRSLESSPFQGRREAGTVPADTQEMEKLAQLGLRMLQSQGGAVATISAPCSPGLTPARSLSH